MNIKCKYCKQLRCASHCDCAVPGTPTYGKRQGREASRGRPRSTAEANPTVASKMCETSASQEEVSPLERLGELVRWRPLKLSVKVYGPEDQSWRALATAEIKAAKLVVLVTYMYDAKDFHRALVAELRRKDKNFSCILVVDRGVYDVGTSCKEQGAMLRQLRDAGAKTFLAHGYHGQGKLIKHRGSCHIKCCVADNRIAYSGSANFTEGGTKNLELMFRHTGPVVDDICQILRSLLCSSRCEELH